MSSSSRMLVVTCALAACGPSIVQDAGMQTEALPGGTTSTGGVLTDDVGSEATTPLPTTDAQPSEDGSGELEGGNDTSTGRGDEGPTIDPPVQTFDLVRIVEGAPWDILQDTGGIAVDAQERVFVADGVTVFVVEDGIVTTWLDESDGLVSPFDVDVDADGVVYVLDTLGARIVTSTGPHESLVLHEIPELQLPINLGVVDPGLLAIRSHFDGLWTATDEGLAPLLSEREIWGAADCATEELAVSRSGTFVYQPGCNGSPMVMGHLDGAPPWLAFESDFGRLGGYSNSICSTRAPGGGFYSVLEFYEDYWTIRMAYVEETTGNGGGWGLVETSPTLDEGMQLTNEPFGFRYCGIAVSPSSTLYFQTGHELWVGTPLQ